MPRLYLNLPLFFMMANNACWRKLIFIDLDYILVVHSITLEISAHTIMLYMYLKIRFNYFLVFLSLSLKNVHLLCLFGSYPLFNLLKFKVSPSLFERQEYMHAFRQYVLALFKYISFKSCTFQVWSARSQPQHTRHCCCGFHGKQVCHGIVVSSIPNMVWNS